MKMGRLISNIRVGADYSLYFHGFAVVVKLKASFINNRKAGLETEGAGKESDKAQANQDNMLFLLMKAEEEEKRSEADKYKRKRQVKF